MVNVPFCLNAKTYLFHPSPHLSVIVSWYETVAVVGQFMVGQNILNIIVEVNATPAFLEKTIPPVLFVTLNDMYYVPFPKTDTTICV